jgi:TRAP-type C4-dicarboxylate transport system permease small subunit
MITMIIITTMQVIFRFFFEALIWSEEITRFLLVFASLVGAAVAFKRGSHISITFFVNKLPLLLNKIIAISVQTLGILFFVIMAWYGGIMMISEASQSTPALGFSMSWIYLMYPVMGCVILIHLLDGLYDVIRRN